MKRQHGLKIQDIIKLYVCQKKRYNENIKVIILSENLDVALSVIKILHGVFQK